MRNVFKGIVVGSVLFDCVNCRRFVNSDGVVLMFCDRCRVGNLRVIVSLLSAEDVSNVVV